jgi:hypothetical protein
MAFLWIFPIHWGYPTPFLPAASAGNGHARAAQAARFFGQAPPGCHQPGKLMGKSMENLWESIRNGGLNGTSLDGLLFHRVWLGGNSPPNKFKLIFYMFYMDLPQKSWISSKADGFIAGNTAGTSQQLALTNGFLSRCPSQCSLFWLAWSRCLNLELKSGTLLHTLEWKHTVLECRRRQSGKMWERRSAIWRWICFFGNLSDN